MAPGCRKAVSERLGGNNTAGWVRKPVDWWAMTDQFQPVRAASLATALERLLSPATSDARVVVRLIDSPLGALAAAATDEGLALLEFANNDRLERQVGGLFRHFGPTRGGEHPMIDQVAGEISEYFAGTRHQFDVPLVIRGTAFQEQVWRELLTIPYGETRAYADLAESLGLRNGQRAVGLANGMNRIAIIIPCHRVIERAGGLRGYGGGLWRKKFLLDHEARTAPTGALAGTPLARSAIHEPDAGPRPPQS